MRSTRPQRGQSVGGRITLKELRKQMPAEFRVSLVDLHDSVGQQKRVGQIQHFRRAVDVSFDGAPTGGFSPRAIRCIDSVQPEKVVEDKFSGKNAGFGSWPGLAVKPN